MPSSIRTTSQRPIEEVGRCDVEDWAILPEGAAYTPYDPDNPDHNPSGKS